MTSSLRHLVWVALVALVVGGLLLAGPASGSPAPQPDTGEPAAPAVGQPEGQALEHGEGAEGGHEGGVLSVVARLFNFAVLVGILWYFLKTPLATYLRNRSTQIRSDLVEAGEMRRTATEQLAALDAKMQSLPAELDALRARGTEEIAAEQARIRQAAEAQRQRLLEQMRREIDLHSRLARRELTHYAAELATRVASDRLQRSITADDQLRLIDGYADQVARGPR